MRWSNSRVRDRIRRYRHRDPGTGSPDVAAGRPASAKARQTVQPGGQRRTGKGDALHRQLASRQGAIVLHVTTTAALTTTAAEDDRMEISPYVMFAGRVYGALAEGGTVVMPIGETFWALRFGMLKDRFGVSWMVNCSKPR